MGFLNQIQNMFGKKNADKPETEQNTAEKAKEKAESAPETSETAEAPKQPEENKPSPQPAEAPEKPAEKNPLSIEQQQKWLRAVNEVYPALMVGSSSGVDEPLRKVNPAAKPNEPNSALSCIARSAKMMNDILGMIDPEAASKRWADLSDDQLREALEAMNWYSHILKEEYRGNLVKAYAKLEEECKKRNVTLPASAPVQVDLVTLLRSMPAAFVDIVPGLRKPWPAVDVAGYIHIFDSEEEAKAQGEKNGFETRKMTGTEIASKLPEMALVGMNKIFLHQNGKIARLQFNAPMFNNALQLLMIRFLQATRGKTPEHMAFAQTLWNNLCHQIPQAFFFVPVGIQGEDAGADIEDNTIRVFENAGKALKEQADKGHPIVFRGFPFAANPDEKPMHLRTIRNSINNDEFLPAFTDLTGALAIWKGHAHFALATFDDLKNAYKPTKGILLNPNGQCLTLQAKQIAEIESERNSQPKVFVYKKEEKPQETPAEPKKV